MFNIVKSGTFSLKMRKSNSSEKKKMKRPMFCPSLQRKSEGRRKLTTSMERIDSYMSNTYLGKMRAAGQIQKASISKTFFEKNKRKARRVIRILLSLSFSLERKNSSGFDETIFLVLKRYLLVFALVSLFRNIYFLFLFCLVRF